MEEIFKVLLAIILEQQDYFVCPYIPTVEQILCTSVPLISVLEREFQIIFSWELVKWNRLFHALKLPLQFQYLQLLEAKCGKWFGAVHWMTCGYLSPAPTGQEIAEQGRGEVSQLDRNGILSFATVWYNWYNTRIKPRFYPYPTTHKLRLAKG